MIGATEDVGGLSGGEIWDEWETLTLADKIIYVNRLHETAPFATKLWNDYVTAMSKNETIKIESADRANVAALDILERLKNAAIAKTFDAIEAELATFAAQDEPIYLINRQRVSMVQWQANVEEVLPIISSSCKKAVREKYLRTVIKTANIIIVGKGTKLTGPKNSPRRPPAGLLVASISNDFLYVHAVCASQGALGKQMIGVAETWARKESLKGVFLSSLAHVVGYYKKLNYSFCKPNKQHTAKDEAYWNRAFERLASPLVQKYKADLSWEHIMNTSDADASAYRRFLTLLMKKKLPHDDNCTTLAQCNENGFTMTKHFTEHSGSSSSSSSSSRGGGGGGGGGGSSSSSSSSSSISRGGGGGGSSSSRGGGGGGW